MQHWYDNLDVTDEGFSVTLNFGDSPEPLYIPYDAIKTFVDPSVEFGLRFETQNDEDEDDAEDAPESAPVPATTASSAKRRKGSEKGTKQSPKDAEIVSLDSFRK
jgi:hypothetical protein